MSLRVGVIGLGTMGRYHLNSWAQCRKAELVAVCDIIKPLAKSTASKYEVDKYFTDYHELLALKDVDAVSVVVPPFLHAPVTCDVAAAGKHVLCEKPMAMNAEEARRMVDACSKAGVKLGIGSGRTRFNPEAEMAKAYVSSGRLGQVYYARSSSFRFRGRPGYDILKESKWFLDSSKAGGGAMIDTACYTIDRMLYLTGSPQPVAASAMTFKGVGKPVKTRTTFDVEEHGTFLVRFEGGLVATFEHAWVSNMEGGDGTSLLGTKGGLKLGNEVLTYYAEQGGRLAATTTYLPSRPTYTMASQQNDLADDFVKACLEDKMPKTPGEDGLKVMQALSMGYLSAKLGREVTLKELAQ